jgi:hypothetical protein
MSEVCLALANLDSKFKFSKMAHARNLNFSKICDYFEDWVQKINKKWRFSPMKLH